MLTLGKAKHSIGLIITKLRISGTNAGLKVCTEAFGFGSDLAQDLINFFGWVKPDGHRNLGKLGGSMGQASMVVKLAS